MTSPSGTPNARPGREPETAAFETARVVRRRGRPSIFILGFLAVVGALVAVGVGGRASVGATFPPVALGSAGVTATPTATPTPAASRPRPSFGPVPVITSGPGQIQLSASRRTEGVFVHGDVFVPKVTWVYVSLRDDTGRTAGWASVSVPGAAGAAPGTGPSLRFDVDLGVPAGFDGPLSLFANAYDSTGLLVGTTQLELGSL